LGVGDIEEEEKEEEEEEEEEAANGRRGEKRSGLRLGML